MSEDKVTILTNTAANVETSLVSVFSLCLHRRRDNAAQKPLSALSLSLTRSVPGLLLLGFIVINREKSGMVDKQGHVSDDVNYASWPASCQTILTCPIAVQNNWHIREQFFGDC